MRKIAYHPDGTVIEFRSDDHSYIDDQDRRYVSVTRVVGEFFPTFDTEKMAKRCSQKPDGKYAGLSPDEILSMWDTERDRGQSEGTNVHEYAEALLIDAPERQRPKAISARCDDLFLGVDLAVSWLRKIMGAETIGAETIVFSPGWPRLAGTIDGLISIPKKRKIVIIDWKQNKEITDTDFYEKTGIGPLSGLADTDFNKYSLQLSLYRHIIETERYFDLGSWELSAALIHIIPGAFRVIKVPYLKKEVEAVQAAWQQKRRTE